jgi:hypothetical protein
MQRSQDDTKAIRRGAILLVATAVVVIAETLVDPANTDKARKIYDAAAAHPGRMIGSAYLLLLSAALVVPAVFGLVRALDGRGRTAGRIAAAAAVLGALGHSTLAGLYLFWSQLPKGNATREQMVPLLQRFNDSSAVAGLFPLIIAFGVAFLALFIAMHRARVTPRWLIVPVVIGFLADVGGTSSVASEAIFFTLLVLAVAVLAAAVLRGPRAAERPIGSSQLATG